MMAPTPDVAKEGGMKDYEDGCEIFVERWNGNRTRITGYLKVERWKGGMVER